jgi:hypothetical protein
LRYKPDGGKVTYWSGGATSTANRCRIGSYPDTEWLKLKPQLRDGGR